MANTVLTPSIIAKSAVRILENELVMAGRVYRGYEEEFDKKVNGYEAGDTISIRKPQQFNVRSGAVAPTGASLDQIQEGKLTMTVSLQKGIDFRLSGTDLTLRIEDISDRIIRPAMVRLANQVDVDVMSLFTTVPNWVGMTNGGAEAPVSSFAMFARAAERLDQLSVPQDDRSAVLSPDSYWALAGSQTALFMQKIGDQAYREGEIGDIGDVATYMSQNVPTYSQLSTDILGSVTGTQSTTYASVLNTESVPGTMSLVVGAFTGTDTIKAGTVFVIAGVRAINPVTKAVLAFNQMFTVMADVVLAAGAGTLTISPAIIPVGAAGGFETTDTAAIGGAVISVVGNVAPASYRQNLMFHKNAFALAVVPMVRPPGAVDVARESYKGISVRLIPYYDGTNDQSNYRLDILYGIKTVNPNLATRFSGGTATLGNPNI